MDRPPEDADAADIARFLEENFWEQVTDGLAESGDDHCSEQFDKSP
jgi:hypothetical protein